MGHPHLHQQDRDALEDRGLADDDDNTEDMRKPPGATEGLLTKQIEPPTTTKEF